LRKALDDNSEDTRLIVTIARKGYQFTARVTVVAEVIDIAKHATLQAAATATSKTDARPVEFPTKEKVSKSPQSHLRLRTWFAAAALFAVIAAGIWLYWSYRRPVTLSATDTIVLAGVKNETSDPVFDDALDIVLRYATEQTPYLNILGIDKVSGTLGQLNLPPTTKLTPEVARQVCLRTNSTLVIASSIADAGMSTLARRQIVSHEGQSPEFANKLLIEIKSFACLASPPQLRRAVSWRHRWPDSTNRWRKR
jgi:hypothetical protein